MCYAATFKSHRILLKITRICTSDLCLVDYRLMLDTATTPVASSPLPDYSQFLCQTPAKTSLRYSDVVKLGMCIG